MPPTSQVHHTTQECEPAENNTSGVSEKRTYSGRCIKTPSRYKDFVQTNTTAGAED